MWLWKKKRLFGGEIAPDCAYCRHHVGEGDAARCVLGKSPTEKGCRKFAYDPLKRKPRPAPTLRKGYDPRDFEL